MLAISIPAFGTDVPMFRPQFVSLKLCDEDILGKLVIRHIAFAKFPAFRKPSTIRQKPSFIHIPPMAVIGRK